MHSFTVPEPEKFGACSYHGLFEHQTSLWGAQNIVLEHFWVAIILMKKTSVNLILNLVFSIWKEIGYSQKEWIDNLKSEYLFPEG